MYTHSSLAFSVGGGCAGAVAATGVIYGGLMYCVCTVGFCTGVVVFTGTAGVFPSAYFLASSYFGCSGSGHTPCVSLLLLNLNLYSGAATVSYCVGLVARLFFASASITNAIYRSMIESSLSTDSEVEIVSMTAIGIASSLPFFDGGGAYCLVVARSVLVVGPSNSSGTVMTRSITFGSDTAGVGVVTCTVLFWGGVITCMSGFGLDVVPASIRPSNFLRANWKFVYTAYWNVAASLCTLAISAAICVWMACAMVFAVGLYSGLTFILSARFCISRSYILFVIAFSRSCSARASACPGWPSLLFSSISRRRCACLFYVSLNSFSVSLKSLI
jgi:hypothetical protein